MSAKETQKSKIISQDRVKILLKHSSTQNPVLSFQEFQTVAVYAAGLNYLIRLIKSKKYLHRLAILLIA